MLSQLGGGIIKILLLFNLLFYKRKKFNFSKALYFMKHGYPVVEGHQDATRVIIHDGHFVAYVKHNRTRSYACVIQDNSIIYSKEWMLVHDV